MSIVVNSKTSNNFRNKILECMAGLWLVLVQNVPVVKYDGASPLCDVSILTKVCFGRVVCPACGHVSMRKVEPI